MARPVYPHELTDPDFQWLVNSYRENCPELVTVDMSCLPVVMILLEEVVGAIDDEEETQTDQPIPVDDDWAGGGKE